VRTALQQDKERKRFAHLQPLKQTRIRYIGRPPSATTATAAFAIHQQEQNQIIAAALAADDFAAEHAVQDHMHREVEVPV
jgi:2-oxoglutarate dehydrogenase C-terminal